MLQQARCTLGAVAQGELRARKGIIRDLDVEEGAKGANADALEVMVAHGHLVIEALTRMAEETTRLLALSQEKIETGCHFLSVMDEGAAGELVAAAELDEEAAKLLPLLRLLLLSLSNQRNLSLLESRLRDF